MTSQRIKELHEKALAKKRGAVAESIRHTVEAHEELTQATLLVAYASLRTAEALEKQNELLVTQHTCEIPQREELPDLSGRTEEIGRGRD
jgi:hypothetical protein